MQVERRTIGLTLAAVASVSSIFGAVLYYLHKKNDEGEEERNHTLYTSRQILIEVQVPFGSVPLVIGREGQTIKQIQKDTGAYVNFKDEVVGAKDRICVIRGSVETAPQAEAAILKIIREQPKVETVEMLVPQRACSIIIGKGGSNIRHLCKLSGAKVSVDRITWHKNANDSRKIYIKGTSEQIAQARTLLEEKVKEANDIRDKMELSTANRKPRLKGKNLCIEAPEENEEEVVLKKQVELIATASDGFMEVMVSTSASAGHFWVQVHGPKVTDLDKLVDQMSEYYRNELNRQDNQLKNFSEGDVVAAVFPHDKMWYRARVDKVIRKEEDYEDDVKLDVYFVDFGDCEVVSSRDTSQLQPEFLKLQYQAVECFLANVKPIDNNEWSEEAFDVFNDLTHCAQWKVLMARVEGYRTSDGHPIPCVKLVDLNDSMNIDIGEELVKRGYAVADSGKPAASPM